MEGGDGGAEAAARAGQTDAAGAAAGGGGAAPHQRGGGGGQLPGGGAGPRRPRHGARVLPGGPLGPRKGESRVYLYITPGPFSFPAISGAFSPLRSKSDIQFHYVGCSSIAGWGVKSKIVSCDQQGFKFSKQLSLLKTALVFYPSLFVLGKALFCIFLHRLMIFKLFHPDVLPLKTDNKCQIFTMFAVLIRSAGTSLQQRLLQNCCCVEIQSRTLDVQHSQQLMSDEFWGAQGGDLRHALANDTQDEFAWHRRGRGVAIDVVRALCFMHNVAGVIHRYVAAAPAHQ